MSSTFPTRFANPRRDSFCSAPATAQGAVAWTVSLPETEMLDRPDLVTWDQSIVVAVHETTYVYSADGEERWQRKRRINSPISVANGLLYSETQGLNLQAVNIAGSTVLDAAPFPGLSNHEMTVTQLWPREMDFVATVLWVAPRYDDSASDAEQISPEVRGLRMEYGHSIANWSTYCEGRQSLPALFLPKSAGLAR